MRRFNWRKIIMSPEVIIVLIVFVLVNGTINIKNKYYGKEIYDVEKNIKQIIETSETIPETITKDKIEINDLFEDEIFTITAYDLSFQSCNKKPSSRGFGITRNGYDLRGHTWKSARVIATDPKIIPLGSIVYIQFINEDYFNYNGVYIAEDTGGAIKDNRIDLFIEDCGETVSSEAMEFGVTKAKIIILKEGGIE